MTITKLGAVASTNRYCEALDLSEVEDFTCFWALTQTAGIGQRGNVWHSAPGQNLTFSLVLHPDFLPADRQFLLTETLAFALCDFLTIFNFESSIQIKWPNDIYIAGHKICGTLTSTRIHTQAFKHSSIQAIISSAICGIGLNVNETDFPNWLPNPTSLALLTGQHYELEPLLKKLLSCIEKRYTALQSGIDPEPDYLARLMNLNTPARYLYNNEEITATITGIDPHGRLLLTTTTGQHLSCGMKEIAFL